MNKRLFTPIIFALGFLYIGTAMAIEEPQYDVVFSEDQFEVRHYAPVLIAETVVDGDMDQASNKGFRLIADFIFGNNQLPSSTQESKIAMTAPVTITPQSSKIAMTAPVTVEPQSLEKNIQAANKWRVHFVMPSQYTLANIPKPKNDEVKLKELPRKYFVVLKYSGFNTVSRVQNKTDQAVEWAHKKSFKLIGAPQLSRYNPPWTLPMFRRNEIMVEISAP